MSATKKPKSSKRRTHCTRCGERIIGAGFKFGGRTLCFLCLEDIKKGE